MSAALVITARETLEASLLLGVILAALRQHGADRRVRDVWLGLTAAIVASILLGLGLYAAFGNLEGPWREGAEGVVMLLAAGVLTYVLWWLRGASQHVAATLRAGTENAATAGSAFALGALVFLVVFREGAETVLYLGAAAAEDGWNGVLAGAALGIATAGVAGYGVYRGGTRMLDVRRFFAVTTVVLLAFAAGLVARATLALQAAGVFPGTISVWHAGGILSDRHGPGSLAHALFGYTASPSLLELTFWASYLVVVVSLWRQAGPVAAHRPMRPLGRDYGDWFYRLIRLPRLTTVLRLSMAALLASLLVVALFDVPVGGLDGKGPLSVGPFSNAENENSVFSLAVWVIWLPFLTLFTALLGRIWCGNLCPMRLVTDAARRLGDRLGLRGTAVPSLLREGWSLPATFIVVTFLVKWWPVQQVAAAGAAFFLIFLSLAFVAGMLFRRGAWCRYFCPIGGWLARISRLSPLALRADPSACATCLDKPCITGTAVAPACPVALNPPRLKTNQQCLSCWSCVLNCPKERSSLKLQLRRPGQELLAPTAPNRWESIFVASLLGMYVAAGHRSPALAGASWPALLFGLVSAATLLYFMLCAVAAPLAGISFRKALGTFGYIFLPLEFATALIAFGDDSLEFFGIVQPAAAVLLALGFVWSLVTGASILRRHAISGSRALAASVPIGATLVALLFLWMHWYTAGTVIDLT